MAENFVVLITCVCVFVCVSRDIVSWMGFFFHSPTIPSASNLTSRHPHAPPLHPPSQQISTRPRLPDRPAGTPHTRRTTRPSTTRRTPSSTPLRLRGPSRPTARGGRASTATSAPAAAGWGGRTWGGRRAGGSASAEAAAAGRPVLLRLRGPRRLRSSVRHACAKIRREKQGSECIRFCFLTWHGHSIAPQAKNTQQNKRNTKQVTKRIRA